MDGVELAQLARIGFLAQLAEEIAQASWWPSHAAALQQRLESRGRHARSGKRGRAPRGGGTPHLPTLEAALEALVIGVPEIPEVDIAAIHARWEADERATLPAVERSLGIDDESDT